MKVSNNALNFLLAQYRAIFKRAYVKGLASAVLLTAGLAAGQAQADSLSGTTALSGEDAITITGVSGSATGYDYLQIKGSGTDAAWNADVTISGGEPTSGTSGNYIQASGGALTLTGNGTLNISITDPETEVASGGLLLQGGASGGVTVNIAKVDVTRGTLTLEDGNQSGGATLIAGDIAVGSATGTAGTGNGVIELSAASGGTVTLGDQTSSTISVNADGKLVMNISSGTGTVAAKSFSIAKGGLFKVNGSGTTSVTTTEDLNVAQGGFFTVTGSGTTTFNGPSAQVDGNLLIDSDSKLNLNTTPATGTVTLGASSNAQIAGTLTVNSGTLEVEDGATLNATSASGALAVSASDSGAVTTLRIDSDTLKGFLTSGSTNLTAITADGKLDGTATDNNGRVNLTAGSGTVVLEFSDTDKKVDLADYKFSGSAAAGYIQVSGSVTASGTDIAVSKKIDNAASLSIVANNLTLGSDEYVGSSADLGFSGATAQNLTVISSGGDDFVLGEDVTLDVTLSDEDAAVTVTNGKIQGDLTLASGSGSLTVAHGTYSHDGNLTISGGTLKVTNVERGDEGNLDSILDLDQGLTIANVSGSTISVEGGAPGVTTVLDISDIKSTDFVVNSGAVAAKVEAKNGGMIIATGEQLAKLLQTSGSAPYVEGGTFLIVNDATLDASALTSGTSGSATKFTFSSGSGGTLQVDDELAINGSGGTFTLNLGDKAEVIAETLNLTNASGDAPSITYGAATLQSGKYTALKSLTSESATTDIQISGTAAVSLGGIDGDGSNTDPYTALSTGGTIGSKLTVNSASGSLFIESGRWSTSQDLAVSAGTLTIGSVDADGNGLADAQGNAITAGLSATTLNLSGTGSAVVTKVGTLTVDELTTSAKTLEVQGTAIINGNRVTSGTGASATTTYGINLAANSIDVGVGATVTIGEDATSAITVSKDKNTSNNYLTIAADTFNGKVFTVKSAGEVQFSFGDTVVFNKDSIAEFRNTLFNYDTQKGVIDGFINLGDAKIDGLAVAEDGTVAWGTLAGYTDILADVTTNGLAEAKVTGITDGANVRGNVGSLETTADYVSDVIQVDGNLTLNNAADNGGNFAATADGAVLGLDVTTPADVVLNNGGNIGDITFSEADSSLTVNSAQGTTKIAAIDGSEANVAFTTGTATVAGATTAATLSTAAGTTTTFTGAVTVGEDAVGTNVVSNIAGTTTFEANASFAQAATFAGSTTFKQDVSFEDAVTINGGTTSVNTQDATATFAQDAKILNGGLLQAQNVVLETDAGVFAVGSDTTAENQTGTGYLEAASFTLAGNDLVVDPAYGQRTSIAAIKGFADEVSSETDAGVVDGRIFVGQNAALDVGTTASIAHMQEFIKNYQTNNGSLVQDEVGAVMYVSDKLTVKNDGRIILDSQNGQDRLLSNAKKQGQYGVDGKNADMFLGKHTVLAIGDNILEDGSAIHFDKIGAGIMAEDGSATVVLDGDKFLNSSSITLFTDKDGGVMVMGDQDIRVETLNGVMYFMLEAGKVTEAKSLQLDTYKIDSAYLGATDESRNLLLAYASRTANWEEYYSQDLTTPTTPTTLGAGEGTQTPTPPARVEREYLVAGLASKGEATWDSTTNSIVVTSAAQQAGLTDDDFTAVAITDDTGAVVDYEVYRLAHNEFLEAVARNTDGRALDSASLQGVFAGSAQAALLAARTSQDAVAGRTGVGASSSALTFADNGQGGGVWVAPIYVSQDSDGFAVENKDYGVDIDLYGVALGGDYTLANGVRVGAFFNVGSGDADGNGQASGVSNDFDYYGVGLYAGYNVGQFSVVGDLSYTAVDSDVEASTSVGKLSSSFDTDNFSVGVTGQYQFVFGATTVTPHAGLRYSALSIDDYRIETGYADGGNFDSDNLSVFSIPVGVTIAQEFTAGSWNVKPSFDLTLSGNFGDDEIDANTNWDGVANWSSNYTAEFIDNFTYGATLGVAAKSGAFSLGVGVSYTGSENTDEFGATANARFTF